MRTIRTLGTLSICVLSALSTGCHGHGRTDYDGGIDPASELCRRNADSCKGGIQLRINTCPRVDLLATPARIAPNGLSMITAAVFDAEGNSVTSEWFGDPDGTLDISALPTAYYRCESIGRKTITVVVKDEFECETMEQIEITCVDAQSFENAGSAPLQSP
ncbi:MAG TPA: hypothetical protein VI299_15345 [Polyangiales bacterium]